MCVNREDMPGMYMWVLAHSTVCMPNSWLPAWYAHSCQKQSGVVQGSRLVMVMVAEAAVVVAVVGGWLAYLPRAHPQGKNISSLA